MSAPREPSELRPVTVEDGAVREDRGPMVFTSYDCGSCGRHVWRAAPAGPVYEPGGRVLHEHTATPPAPAAGSLPTHAEQMAEYERRMAVYNAARERGEKPPHPVAPHTPGWAGSGLTAPAADPASVDAMRALNHDLYALLGDEDLTDAKLRAASEGLLPRCADAMKTLRWRLAAAERERDKAVAENRLRARAVDRWVPCADHRDKTPDGVCQVCKREKAERALAEARAALDEERARVAQLTIEANAVTCDRDHLLFTLREVEEGRDEYRLMLDFLLDASHTDDGGYTVMQTHVDAVDDESVWDAVLNAAECWHAARRAGEEG